MTQALLMGVRTSSDLETNIVAVERIKEYSDIPTEVYFVLTYVLKFHIRSINVVLRLNGWPMKGRLKIGRQKAK